MSASSLEPVRPAPHSIPADGFRGLRQNWTGDLLSGFVIFLIALPLSVGIALASGAPATAGLLGAIVGGLLGAFVGGSYVTINGPAAGLIVIVLGAVQDLGQGDPATGFRRMLAAVVLAGLLQVAMGVLRLGALGVGVPGSVIHGMLSAIGFIILVKQLPISLGAVPHTKEILGMVAEIPQYLAGMNPEVALITAVGLFFIAGLKTYKGNWTKYVPAPLIVVIAGMALARLFDFDHSHLVSSHRLNFEVGPKLLLTLPDNLASAIVFPDFSQVFSLPSLRWAVTLALVASIESLLTAAAIDRLDPAGRVSHLDRELLGKGVCNALLGLIGGLPIIAEVVRSSANVRNGAKTRWANFFHGAFILSFLILFPHLLHEIPLAALAAVLMSVGYGLAHPTQVLHTARIGKDHFAAFLTTFLVTISSDLLLGVAAGIMVELAFNFARGGKISSLFRVQIDEEEDANGERTLRIRSPLTFTNYISLKNRLEHEAATKKLVLDLSKSPIVDHTVLDNLHRYQAARLQAGFQVLLSFSEEHRAVSKHPLAARRRRSAGGR